MPSFDEERRQWTTISCTCRIENGQVARLSRNALGLCQEGGAIFACQCLVFVQ
jgi:hypothetical protein